MITHDDEVPFGQHPHDQPPAEWVNWLNETQPRCPQCQARPIHLPGAKTCLECRSDRPSEATRRVMYGILHAGGRYCGKCLVRPVAGVNRRSCDPCYARRTTPTLRKKLDDLLEQAYPFFLETQNQIVIAQRAKNRQDAMEALFRARDSYGKTSPILQVAWNQVDRINGLNAETGHVAAHAYNHAVAESERLRDLIEVTYTGLDVRFPGAANGYPPGAVPMEAPTGPAEQQQQLQQQQQQQYHQQQQYQQQQHLQHQQQQQEDEQEEQQ